MWGAVLGEARCVTAHPTISAWVINAPHARSSFRRTPESSVSVGGLRPPYGSLRPPYERAIRGGHIIPSRAVMLCRVCTVDAGGEVRGEIGGHALDHDFRTGLD